MINCYNANYKMIDKNGDKYKLCIEIDETPYDPREFFDNISHMICFHGRYNLGDEHNFANPNELNKYLEKIKDVAVIKPLYMLDHSGITISTKDFCDPWDSGQIGYVYVLKNELLELTSANENNWEEKGREIIDSEVETYDDYVRGNVYGYTIYKEIKIQKKCPHCDEIIDEHFDLVYYDSCWGFYGDDAETNGIMDNVSSYFKIVDEWRDE